MKSCETIEEIVKFMKSRHFSDPKQAMYGVKSLRKKNGKRMAFEVVTGFKMNNFEAYEDTRTLIIDHHSHGYEYKGQKKHTTSWRLYLHDLSVINVYDHKTEFFSMASIDFTYLQDDNDSQIERMQEWINSHAGIIRAQWLAKNRDVDRILDGINGDLYLSEQDTGRRHIDLDD